MEKVESQIAALSKPSANLDEKKIEKIIDFLKRLPELYKAFTKPERKLFLHWLVKNIWIQGKKIVDVTYTEGFQALIDRDLVRISDTWDTVQKRARVHQKKIGRSIPGFCVCESDVFPLSFLNFPEQSVNCFVRRRKK